VVAQHRTIPNPAGWSKTLLELAACSPDEDAPRIIAHAADIARLAPDAMNALGEAVGAARGDLRTSLAGELVALARKSREKNQVGALWALARGLGPQPYDEVSLRLAREAFAQPEKVVRSTAGCLGTLFAVMSKEEKEALAAVLIETLAPSELPASARALRLESDLKKAMASEGVMLLAFILGNSRTLRPPEEVHALQAELWRRVLSTLRASTKPLDTDYGLRGAIDTLVYGLVPEEQSALDALIALVTPLGDALHFQVRASLARAAARLAGRESTRSEAWEKADAEIGNVQSVDSLSAFLRKRGDEHVYPWFIKLVAEAGWAEEYARWALNLPDPTARITIWSHLWSQLDAAAQASIARVLEEAMRGEQKTSMYARLAIFDGTAPIERVGLSTALGLWSVDGSARHPRAVEIPRLVPYLRLLGGPGAVALAADAVWAALSWFQPKQAF
jgi:hypothetical protein